MRSATRSVYWTSGDNVHLVPAPLLIGILRLHLVVLLDFSEYTFTWRHDDCFGQRNWWRRRWYYLVHQQLYNLQYRWSVFCHFRQPHIIIARTIFAVYCILTEDLTATVAVVVELAAVPLATVSLQLGTFVVETQLLRYVAFWSCLLPEVVTLPGGWLHRTVIVWNWKVIKQWYTMDKSN